MPDITNTLAAPIADDLLSVEAGELRLVASREHASGRIVFPPRALDDDRFDRVLLGTRGKLWSWTIQRFRPKSPPYAGPDAFEPYAVGYIELEGQLVIEARLTGVPFDQLHIGMDMQLVPLPFTLASGLERTTFAFTSSMGDAA
jgi:uncharacterized OB-fold protein